MIIRTKLATEEQKKLILEGRAFFLYLQRQVDLITDIDIKPLFILPDYLWNTHQPRTIFH